MAVVPAGIRLRVAGVVAGAQCRVICANGKEDGLGRIGGRTEMVGGVPMGGRGSLLTGSGVHGAAPLIIPSQIGEDPTVAGVIRSQ